MRTTDLGAVDFAGIELFSRVARSGSIAAAAREIGITPSRATRRLAALEQSLGVRLFNRTTRHIALTRAGETALDWAQTALRSFDAMSNEMATVRGSPAGHIKVAAPHFGMRFYLPAILAKFLRKYPQITVEVTTTDSLVNLTEENFDVVVRYGFLPDSRAVATRLTEFTRIVCGSPDYLAEWGTPATLNDLSRHQIVVDRQSDLDNWSFRINNQVYHQPIRPCLAVDNSMVVAPLCAAGAGLARLTLPNAHADLDSGRIVRVLAEYECVETSGENASLWIVHLGKNLPYRVRLLVDHLKREIPIARNSLFASPDEDAPTTNTASSAA